MTQSDVDCQFWGELPFVLNVSEKRVLDVFRKRGKKVASIVVRQVQQESGVSVRKALVGVAVSACLASAETILSSKRVDLRLEKAVTIVSVVNTKLEGVI